MKNVNVFYITKNDEFDGNTDFRLEDVTKVSIGRRLVYVEFFKDGATCIRAYGRAEFKYVVLQPADDEQTVLPLNLIDRFEARYDAPVSAAYEDFFADSEADNH